MIPEQAENRGDPMDAVAPHGEHPILFSGEMVRAILDGRKTQTRRILKNSTEFKGPYNPAYIEAHKRNEGWRSICPYGKIGDRLWVRETWYSTGTFGADKELLGYAADNDYPHGVCYKVRPSIHMPRKYSRITLEITDIRVERLQDISEADAKAEGVGDVSEYETLWDSINNKGGHGWKTNPWVWVIEFRRVT